VVTKEDSLENEANLVVISVSEVAGPVLVVAVALLEEKKDS
jgi:hypothetical protein